MIACLYYFLRMATYSSKDSMLFWWLAFSSLSIFSYSRPCLLPSSTLSLLLWNLSCSYLFNLSNYKLTWPQLSWTAAPTWCTCTAGYWWSSCTPRWCWSTRSPSPRCLASCRYAGWPKFACMLPIGFARWGPWIAFKIIAGRPRASAKGAAFGSGSSCWAPESSQTYFGLCELFH